MLKKLRTVKILTDVSSDQQNSGLEANVVVDRDTASRLGLSQQAIDDTLYDAFGQRQVSTMYTPLNQYHVVMEVAPQFWQNPSRSTRSTCAPTPAQLVRLSTFTHFAHDTDRARRQPPGSVSLGDDLVQPRAGRRAGRSG